MAIISKQIVKIPSLFSMEISIPPYQRPYKWDARLVNQLLLDLQHHRDKQAYRLGTVVFHRDSENNELFVVDGQQRLITLALLIHCLDETHVPKILYQKLPHTISHQNIKSNYELIRQQICRLDSDEKFELKQFIQSKCELVTVELDDISEAFQFFDSQNARGKELEPYDLLKAFHLREMGETTEEVRQKCVERWENEVNSGLLKKAMDNYLYRIRRWLRGLTGRQFIKADVDLFKGITLAKTKNYPYLQTYRINDYFTEQYENDPVRSVDHHSAHYPFQINQIMINGVRFFEYVHHYVKMVKSLEKPHNTSESAAALYGMLNSYDGRSRDGDRYTRNLFDCLVMHYQDKFGSHGLEKFTLQAFGWAYSMRVQQYAIKLATMDNKALADGSLFHHIEQAIHPAELGRAVIPPVKESDVAKNQSEALTNHLKKLGYIG